MAIEPWNIGIEGKPTLRLINSDAPTIRVEAGPGAGKTLALKRRVLRVVHPTGLNLPGQEVLVVAFNRVISANLDKDIKEQLKDLPDTAQPVIRTVHALCLQVVGRPLRLLMEHEREAMIYDVLCEYPKIAEAYERSHSKTQQALHLHEARLEDHPELWQAVRQWLTRHDAVLIGDLPRLLLDKIKAGDYEGERYTHVIVDEFQDLTEGEQLLFMKLRRPKGFFLALGDSKQSIYKFRGNDKDGLRKLEKLDPDQPVEDLPLPDCYRCPAAVVKAANQLMVLHPPAMGAANEDQANIHLVHWTTPEAEAKGMAAHILANLKAHPKERHLAMVTRKQFGYALRRELSLLDEGVRVDLSFSESLLEEWPVREAFMFLCLLADPDAPTWRAWFAYHNPRHEKESYKPAKRNADAYLRFLTRQHDKITWDAVRDMAKGPQSAVKGRGGSIVWSRAQRLLQQLDALGMDPTATDPSRLIQAITTPSMWAAEGNQDAMLDFDTFRAKADQLLERTANSGKGAAWRLKALVNDLRHAVATREPLAPSAEADLQVTTMWGAKGVTADHVYVLGLCNAALPGKRREEYPGTDADFEEEQRRLFYVTLTRSRRTLVLSRAKLIRPGEALRLGLGQLPMKGRNWSQLLATDFLHDIQDLLPDSVDGKDWKGCE